MLNRHYDFMLEDTLNTEVLNYEVINGLYHYTFKDTIFYTLSGGMRKDKGTIGGNTVIDVYKKDGLIYHVLKKEIEKFVIMRVDKEDRLEKCQIHSAQHLICALFSNEYKVKTVSFQAGEKESTIEMSFQNLDRCMLNQIEEQTNKLIRENIKIEIEYPTREEALEKNKKYEEELPFDGEIRAVVIKDIDYNLCACIHVPSLGYIQSVKFLDYEKTPYGYKISFIAGQQMINYLKEHYEVFKEARKTLAIPELAIMDGINKLLEEKQNLKKEIEELKEENFSNIAKNLTGNRIFHIFEYDSKTLQQFCAFFNSHYDKEYIFLGKYENKLHIVFNKIGKEKFEIAKKLYGIKGGGNEFAQQGGIEYNSALVTYLEGVVNNE
ncbi:MAG: DHHA1 domain-containing protein [Bacilli bacterium]